MADIVKVLKTDSKTYSTLMGIHELLENEDISITQSPHNGLIFRVKDQYFKYVSEGECADSIPFSLEGRFVLCDVFGNTDFYNK